MVNPSFRTSQVQNTPPPVSNTSVWATPPPLIEQCDSDSDSNDSDCDSLDLITTRDTTRPTLQRWTQEGIQTTNSIMDRVLPAANNTLSIPQLTVSMVITTQKKDPIPLLTRFIAKIKRRYNIHGCNYKKRVTPEQQQFELIINATFDVFGQYLQVPKVTRPKILRRDTMARVNPVGRYSQHKQRFSWQQQIVWNARCIYWKTIGMHWYVSKIQ